jgi:CBS domain-containing protein
MKQPVVSFSPQGSVRQAAELMKEHQIGLVIVLEDARLVGILTEGDVLLAVADGPDLDQLPVAELMTKDLLTAAPNQDVVVAPAS